MLLRSARIENFRAIRCATIHFDATTVLIGENDCGRSSAMEAIALALGWNSPGGAFGFQPYHARRDEPAAASDAVPISIALESTSALRASRRFRLTLRVLQFVRVSLSPSSRRVDPGFA